MEKLVKVLLKAARLESEATGHPVSEDFRQRLTMWGAGIFRLVVMGEIKKGKSSLINALLGVRDLVPVSSNVATSTIFKIRYGSQQGYKVHFLKESGKEARSINAHDLDRFGTEDGNPGNREEVDFIEVICPSPLLKSGIVIIDTPGLGGLFKAHKQVTFRYVQRADAVFFVTDSVESPIGKLEDEYLRGIRAMTPYIYFVQTKACSVDTEARLARKRNNLSILSGILEQPEKEIPYFMVDSGLKFEAEETRDAEDMKDSGYPQLMAFIKNVLQADRKTMLASLALAAAAPILAHLQEIATSRKELIRADTEEKRKQREQDIVRLQDELRDWQERKQPEIMADLQQGLHTIRMNAMDQCNQCRPSGEIQIRFEDLIHQSRNMDELRNNMEEINSKLPEFVDEVVRQTMKQMQDEVSSLLNRMAAGTSTEALSVLRSGWAALPHINTSAMGRVRDAVGESDAFQTARTGLYGGMAGIGIASIVGGIIGSVVPVVGTILGSFVGCAISGAWGGAKAVNYQKNQELKAAKQQACGALVQAMSSASARIQSALERSLGDINSEAVKAIHNYLRSRKEELNRQMEDIKNRGRMDGEELDKRKRDASRMERELAMITQGISPWMKPGHS